MDNQGHIRQTVEMVTKQHLEDVPEFRIEFFFAMKPYRLQWILTEKSVLHANGAILRLQNRAELQDLLTQLGMTLPASSINQGISRAMTGAELLYPSVRAFEEEILWSFYRLGRSSR